jgi:hypothetical protein
MGYADNRRTPKMNRRRRQAKLKARIKRHAEIKRAERKAAK